MILGLVLGLVILALIILYYTDDDRDALALFIFSVFTLVLVSSIVGYNVHTQYEVKQQVKPTIKVVIENGKSDTTYIYKFEEEK